MSESVKIDKYVLVTEKSPKMIVFDNSIQRNIVSVNTLSDEHNLALAEMILAELNTGKYEPIVESDTDDGLGENDIVDVGDSDDGDDSIVDDESVNNGE